MWFEGETTPAKFADKLKELMTTVDPATGEPMWQEISSKPGTSVADDGYVFYSKGSSGTDKIYIGIKKGYHSGTNWAFGPRLFICENYTPNPTPGQNGVIESEVNEALRFAVDTTWAMGADQNTHLVRYNMSITKDRVIIVVRNSSLGQRDHHSPSSGQQDHHGRTVMYLGLMNRYSNEPDSTASVIASSYPNVNNTHDSIRAIRNGAKFVGSAYQTAQFQNAPVNSRRGWGRQFHVSNIPLYTNNEGLRGELDGVLSAPYGNESSGPNLPLFGYVTVNGKSYLAVTKSTANWWATYTNFYNTHNHVLLIEVK